MPMSIHLHTAFYPFTSHTTHIVCAVCVLRRVESKLFGRRANNKWTTNIILSLNNNNSRKNWRRLWLLFSTLVSFVRRFPSIWRSSHAWRILREREKPAAAAQEQSWVRTMDVSSYLLTRLQSLSLFAVVCLQDGAAKRRNTDPAPISIVINFSLRLFFNSSDPVIYCTYQPSTLSLSQQRRWQNGKFEYFFRRPEEKSPANFSHSAYHQNENKLKRSSSKRRRAKKSAMRGRIRNGIKVEEECQSMFIIPHHVLFLLRCCFASSSSSSLTRLCWCCPPFTCLGTGQNSSSYVYAWWEMVRNVNVKRGSKSRYCDDEFYTRNIFSASINALLLRMHALTGRINALQQSHAERVVECMKISRQKCCLCVISSRLTTTISCCSVAHRWWCWSARRGCLFYHQREFSSVKSH